MSLDFQRFSPLFMTSNRKNWVSVSCCALIDTTKGDLQFGKTLYKKWSQNSFSFLASSLAETHITVGKKNQANFASYGPVNSKCFMKYYLNRSSSEMSGRPRSSIKVQHHKSGQSSISLKKREREKKKIRFVTQSILSVRLDLNPKIRGAFSRLCSSIWLLLEKKVCYIYKTMNDNYDT